MQLKVHVLDNTAVPPTNILFRLCQAFKINNILGTSQSIKIGTTVCTILVFCYLFLTTAHIVVISVKEIAQVQNS